MAKLLKYVKPNAIILFSALLCATISVLSLLYIPILIGNGVDFIIGKDEVYFEELKIIFLKLIITILIYGNFSWLMNIQTALTSLRTVKYIRINAFESLSKAPLSYFDSTPHGEITQRIVSDVEAVSVGLLQGFTQAFSGIVTIIGTLVYMFSINKTLSLVVVLITPLSLIIAYLIAKGTHKKFVETNRINGELTSFIEEMVSNQRIIKTFNYEQRSIEHFEEVNQRLKKASFASQVYTCIINPSTRFINSLVYASVGVVGAYLIITNKAVGFTIGSLSCFLAYANQYTKPFNEVSGVISEISQSVACSNRIFEIIELQREENEDYKEELDTSLGRVELRDVCFSYNPEIKLIENLNLKIEPGQNIAIVGPTGCGKTTLINLLMRFYEVNKGMILVDGNNVKDLKRESVRSFYGMVLQDTWVFNGTIRENISYSKKDATLDEIITACKSAHIHSAITRLKNGYDTKISQTSFSTGQLQLICIARVMLNNPPMLILDEATSSIDTLTEVKIQQAFKKMMVNKTCFIIAHRLSTIVHADLIIVMNKGSVLECGNHVELLKAKGFYYNLFTSQYQSLE